jgi:SAM-dependent methyltransferase
MQIYEAETEQLLASQNRDPLLRHLTATIVGLARRYRPPTGGVRAVDIGCGVGRTTLALARLGYQAVGFDPSARVVALAQEAAQGAHLPVEFAVGDATAPAAPEWLAKFDVAVCSEVIEHVPEPARVVSFAQQVLRTGGFLILTTPHDQQQWSVIDAYAGHVQRFSVAQLAALLASDFSVLELTTEGFPFQRLVMGVYGRMAQRPGYRHEFAAYGETPMYRLYTRLMPVLLQVDHQLRRLREGTTLVAVARKVA